MYDEMMSDAILSLSMYSGSLCPLSLLILNWIGRSLFLSLLDSANTIRCHVVVDASISIHLVQKPHHTAIVEMIKDQGLDPAKTM